MKKPKQPSQGRPPPFHGFGRTGLPMLPYPRELSEKAVREFTGDCQTEEDPVPTHKKKKRTDLNGINPAELDCSYWYG